MSSRRGIIVLLLTLLMGASTLLAGCGQKGPLYLPEPVDQEETEDADSDS